MSKASFSKKISGPVLLAVFYLVVSKFCFVFLMTIVTSTVLMDKKASPQINQIINDISFQYMFIAYSVGAIFTLFVCWAGDRAFSRENMVWNFPGLRFWLLEDESKKEFMRGVGTGLLVPLVVITLLQMSQQLNFLGTFITSDTSSPIFTLFLINALALASTVLCEEYIFRHKILGTLLSRISPMNSVLLTSLGYVLVKHFQFHLAWMDYISLFLLSLIAGFFFLRTQRIFRSIGFLGTLYGIIHFVCGLNLWGHSTAGLFLFTDSKSAFTLITGGSDGPLASISIISLLLLVTISAYWAWKKGR